MKIKVNIICIFILFQSFFICFSQVSIKKDFEQYNLQKRNTFVICSNFIYTIENKTDSIIWVWFENQNFDNANNQIQNYFFKLKGNFNLFILFTDANITFIDFKPTVFSTFLKYIEPENNFIIQFYSNKTLNEKDKNDIFNYLEKHIVIVTDKDIENIIKYNIRELQKMHPANNRLEFYTSDYITLPLEVFDIN